MSHPNERAGCDDDCDGFWHVCWQCGGEGILESDDDCGEVEEAPCQLCRADGGWPCPNAEEVP
jgi:hypothetical protein